MADRGPLARRMTVLASISSSIVGSNTKGFTKLSTSTMQVFSAMPRIRITLSSSTTKKAPSSSFTKATVHA